MIDHLCELSDPAALSYILDWEGNPVTAPAVGESVETIWSGSAVIILGVKIVRAMAVLDASGDIAAPEEIAPGLWVVFRGNALLSLPIEPVIVTDSDRAAAGLPYIIAKSDAYDWSLLRSTVWPTFFGDGYPFGASVGPDMLIP
jgi:hypothetical protein